MTKTPEYRIYQSMRSRCELADHVGYARYGGRGIKVCARWGASFEAFFADMGPRPSKKHSLDRKDNDGNYEPDNCRWATPTEQSRNRCGNRRVEWSGENLTVAEWSERTGIGFTTLRFRLDKGWPLDRVFAAPVRRKAPNGAGDQKKAYRAQARVRVAA